MYPNEVILGTVCILQLILLIALGVWNASLYRENHAMQDLLDDLSTQLQEAIQARKSSYDRRS